MNKGYKLFGGFIGVLLLAGISAKANKTVGNMTDENDTVQAKSAATHIPEHSVIDEVEWVVFCFFVFLVKTGFHHVGQQENP